MKNEIMKFLLAIILLLPCAMLFTACGNLKELEGKTLVFSKVEVTGTLIKEDYEDLYKTISYEFGETTLTYKDGDIEESYEYKLENGKVYTRMEGAEYPKEAFAEISGKYMVITVTTDAGIAKIYFEAK